MFLLSFTIAVLAHVGAGFENTTEFLNTTANITVVENGSFELERIVQPSQLVVQASATNSSVNSRSEDSKRFKDFRPSPQLETYYEYNKYPVVPAFPEAKRFSSSIVGENPNRSWGGKVVTEHASPWVTKVRFPTRPPVTSFDHPYPFVTNPPVPTTENPVKYGPPNLNFPVQKIPDSISPALLSFPSYGESGRYGGLEFGSIDKFERGPVSVRRPVLDKSQFGLEERPSGDVGGFPWKKIVKFLTAVIPIGILISALTPSVINVSPVNITEKNRARSRENESRQLMSLNFIEELRSKGCDERILCELLISAGSLDNPERNVENLLEVLTQREKSTRKKSEKLRRIMESVKINNCDEFICKVENRNKRKSN